MTVDIRLQKDGTGTKLEEDIDFVVVAGGDGTVRQITKELLDRKVLDKTYPVALLPLGTANNISKTLEIAAETEEIIQSWHSENVKKYDVGKISNVDDASFFGKFWLWFVSLPDAGNGKGG